MFDIAMARGTILVVSGTGYEPDKKHLFIVCSNPCKDEIQLLVPISTYTNSLCDDTCILKPHEHEFIKRVTYVRYQSAILMKRDEIVTGISSNLITPFEDINSNSFLKIRNGFRKSSHTKIKILKYIDENKLF